MIHTTLRGERIKSPSVPHEKHYRPKPPSPRKQAAVRWISEHVGLWFTERELAEGIGRKPGGLDTVLCDLEDKELPFRLCETKEGGGVYYMAIAKGDRNAW